MPDNLWRCVLNWRNTVTSLNAQNVLHFSDVTEVKTADQIGALIDTNWWQGGTGNAMLRGYTSGHVRLESITLSRIFPSPPLGGVPFITQAIAGTQGTAVKHPVLGMVFTLKTGFGGRKHRGRMYHYGAVPTHLTDSGPSGGLLAPTGLPLLFTRWLQEFGPSPATGLQWVLHHRGQLFPALFDPITSIQASVRCCVQRRRNFGIGI